MSTYADWFGTQRLTLLRFAAVLCGDTQTAQDVVQEVAIRAHGRWSHLQGMERPEAYLRRMVVNEHLSWRRKWARLVPVADLSDLQTGRTADPADQVADRAQLRRELDGLPRQQRAVLVLRFYEGLSDPDIAEILGTRPATVRAYASRALAQLRIDMTTSEHTDHEEDLHAH